MSYPCQHTEAAWKEGVRVRLDQALTREDLERGGEYAPYIVNALMGRELYKFNGNVPNTGPVTNLPQGACVAVSVLVDRAGSHPMHVGALPAECALMTDLFSGFEYIATAAALTGDPTLVCRATCQDPLTAAALSLAEIRQMTNDLSALHQDYLPQFKTQQV
ncbi:hypothetical protein EWI61_04910 [Methylolobus aquaticus]|nr:hypothetical protein EWI61_04910 [Methylolobus aquaticus]